jgi:exosortase D (VPLPA-CTERM-specific)
MKAWVMSIALRANVGRPRTELVVAGIAFLIVIAVFWGALSETVGRWYRQEEYGHGFFIPLISGWLLWVRRDALRASVGPLTVMGPLIVAVAISMHLVGEMSALFVLSQLGFVVAICGLIASAGGWQLLRTAFVPVVFLVFAIPLPYFIDSVLTWRLQLISTDLGVLVIRLFQLPVYQEGNIIDLGVYKLQVVEACSGLRYLFPLMSLGFLAAYFFQAPFWQRIFVFVSTIPITIAMNSLRIGIVGVLVNQWGTGMAEGALHFFEGWVIFVCCSLLLLGEIAMLARLGGRNFANTFSVPNITIESSAARSQRYGVLNPASVVSAALLVIGGMAIVNLGTRQEIIPERQRFVEFPRSIGAWHGRPQVLDQDVERTLKLDDYVLSDYQAGSASTVNLWIAYYPTQRKGASPHSPTVCLPGGGWVITSFARTALSSAATASLPVNRAIIEHGSSKQVVYYWFVQRGRPIANEYWSKWYLFTDAILRNRTDGALVRVSSPVYPGETIQRSDERIQSFIREIQPRLEAFIPAEARREPKLQSTHESRETSLGTDGLQGG